MLDNIGHVLYHVLIVIFPVLLFYLQAIRKNMLSNSLHKGMLLGMIIVILILTMSFPVSYANGFEYDFRIIPIIISLLYLGLFQGITAIGIMLLYLSLLGESNIGITLVNYSIIVIILYFLRKKFKRMSVKNKLLSISVVYFALTSTRSIMLATTAQYEKFLTMVIFSIITWITFVLVILLIENIDQQVSLQRELRRSEKLNIISQLAASVAHEVRNPMTTINGFLQLINKDDNITERQRNYIEISLAELARAQDIINDYLSLAKPNNTGSQLVNISEELTKTIELMTSYTNIKNIEVSSTIEDSLYIQGNSDEIKQVFINIIKNGIEAINGNGKIDISAYSDNQKVVIQISDTGEGMTKEQLSRLGTPFYSTKEKGTGIGLTISFQMIEQMKGNIEVKSEMGVGTSFIIRFPTTEVKSKLVVEENNARMLG